MSEKIEGSRVGRCRSVRTFGALDFGRLLGPVEAQYEQLVAGIQGAENQLPCGSTITDQSSEDANPEPNTVGFGFYWNDLAAETGYRRQLDAYSATYVTEDLGSEEAANDTTSGGYSTAGPSSAVHTFRVFGHVGHAPGHGGTPISGDVVSNECVINIQFPDV